MPPPPSVAVATRPPQERSVDSLLFELENTVTTPRHQQHPAIQKWVAENGKGYSQNNYQKNRVASFGLPQKEYK